MALDKYKELYDLSNKLLEEEHGRFNRISQKATNYLSVVSLLLGIATVFGKETISHFIPPTTFLEWLLLNLAFLVFVSLAITWVTVFRAYRFEGLLTRPLSSLISFFQTNALVDIYFAMAKANAKAREENIKVTDRKAKLLEIGHKMILVTASLAAIFTCFYFIYLWTPASLTKADSTLVYSAQPESALVSNTNLSSGANSQITTNLQGTKINTLLPTTTNHTQTKP